MLVNRLRVILLLLIMLLNHLLRLKDGPQRLGLDIICRLQCLFHLHIDFVIVGK